MKPERNADSSRIKLAAPLSRLLVVAGLLLCAVNGMAQPAPPPPLYFQLCSWSFDDTNWYSDLGYSPLSFTNLNNPPSFDGNAVQVDTNVPAWLQYNIAEHDGTTNLTFNEGTVELWFLPDWNSGTGPADWGRLIDVGAYSTNNPSSWWSLYFTPDGSRLNFSSETNGVFTNYLTYPISWDTNTWHFIALTYRFYRASLYVDGQLATNGAGAWYEPSAEVVSNGFFVGSDATGIGQSRGLIDDLATYNYSLSDDEVSNDYTAGLLTLTGGGSHTDYGGGPGLPGGGGGGGGGGTPHYYPPPDYSTNLWLATLGISNNVANLLLSNTVADVLFELQGCTNLAEGDWVSYGFVDGSELTNCVPAFAPASQQGNLFLRIRSWQDTTGTGIPDWWWLEFFGQTTNVNGFATDPADDGYTDLQKFQLGLNPLNYYNTNGPPGFFGYLDASGTNAFIAWSPAPGPVINYSIQRGIEDTNGNYVYSQIGLVSSNSIFFEDVGAITNDNAQNNIYNVEAVYPGNSLSGTDTWQVWWYSSYGSFGPPYGPPLPSNVYAYADATATNVLLWWTPASGMATNYLIVRGILNTTNYEYDYSQIASLDAGTTFYQDTGAINGANAWNNIYEIEAVYPGGGLSSPATSPINSTPPPPTGLSVTVDSTGTNVLLSWSPAPGTVTNYVIERGVLNTNTGVYGYSTIATVGAGTDSFEDVGAITGNNSYNNAYQVETVFLGGATSQFAYAQLAGPPAIPNANIRVSACPIRNGTGRWQVMFSGLPTNSVQAIQLTWTKEAVGSSEESQESISTANVTNGIYLISDTEATNLLAGGPWDYIFLNVQLFGPNGEPGHSLFAGAISGDAPYFVDGRQHMKQNLAFLIRAAATSLPFGGTYNDGTVQLNGAGDANFYSWVELNHSATNFEEFSFLHRQWNAVYENDQMAIALDDLWPFNENYYLSNFLLDTTRTNSPFGSTNFNFQINFATNIPAPPILSASLFCTLQPGFGGSSFDPVPIPSLQWGVTLHDSPVGASLQSGLENVFQLPYQAGVLADEPVSGAIYYQSLPTGGTVDVQNSGDTISTFASQITSPTLQITNYYFVPLINSLPNSALLPSEYDVLGGAVTQPYPVPLYDDFNVTNQTPSLIIGTIGQPMILGGWAKYSINNGGTATGKYGYLGQYFETNALLLDQYGNVTTNSAGVLSPYGEFFPLQAGVAGLVTMPDIDYPYQQGTGIVRIVSMNVDANHDGTMDFSYSGPDQNSSSRPFRFWVDDSTDSGDTGGDGVPGQGAQGNGMVQMNHQWVINGRRDLVNLFPVYLNIGSLFQSNALSAGISATDTNWQFVLSQADGALRFATTDLTPTNYMNFLRDTNESGNLAYWPGNPNYAVLTTISNSGVALSPSFIAGITTNNDGIILVQAWESTTQPLVLTIYHGTNQIAQTSLNLSISGVEQMFRHKSLLINPDSREVPDRLTDASVPNEPDTTDGNFVFVHGYNVNPEQARGWQADMFKRMYWSGSHAKFYGVTWEGYDTQGSIPLFSTTTPNYQTNVVRAYQTAPNLAAFISTLTNSGPVVVAGHSLGNMVTLSALSDWNAPITECFMVDAAVPIEAIDPGAPVNTNMIYSTSSAPWANYATALWASEWFNVWPTNDARSTLSWNGRLSNFGSTAVYDFYSSGEEVLRTSVGAPPPNLFSAIFSEVQQYIASDSGTFAWAWQEKCKGLMSSLLGTPILSSDHGGWALNENLGSGYVFFVDGLETNIPPTVITNSVLQTNAFFDMSYDTAMFTASSSGSTYAQTNRNRILSDAIPAVTLPIGANPVSRLEPPQNLTQNNFDMQANENGWPVGRGAINPLEAINWHHSDIRVVAYPFTYKVFNQIVNDGNLK